MEKTTVQSHDVNVSDTQNVSVKILLSGGHQEILTLKSDTPLLKNLLGTILGRVKAPKNRTLFQIPLGEGRSAIAFSSEDLVAVITDPPVYVRPEESEQTFSDTPEK